MAREPKTPRSGQYHTHSVGDGLRCSFCLRCVTVPSWRAHALGCGAWIAAERLYLAARAVVDEEEDDEQEEESEQEEEDVDEEEDDEQEEESEQEEEDVDEEEDDEQEEEAEQEEEDVDEEEDDEQEKEAEQEEAKAAKKAAREAEAFDNRKEESRAMFERLNPESTLPTVSLCCLRVAAYERFAAYSHCACDII
jgi:cytoskeletal protein RodZ